MAIQTFEYCSLHYLNQWLTYDRGYCESLSNGSTEEKLSVLKSAGGFYRVSRNLPSEFDEKKGLARYQPVLDTLDSVCSEHFTNNIVEKIWEIESKISAKYGKRRVLSLTTKFLWLKIKDPILLYDSQARIALGTKDDDLPAYYQKWGEGFEQHEKDIKKACSQLSDLHLYAVDQRNGTREYIKEVSSNSWFHKRVFDIYLWSKGNKA